MQHVAIQFVPGRLSGSAPAARNARRSAASCCTWVLAGAAEQLGTASTRLACVSGKLFRVLTGGGVRRSAAATYSRVYIATHSELHRLATAALAAAL